jgi:hypothetical protein
MLKANEKLSLNINNKGSLMARRDLKLGPEEFKKCRESLLNKKV